MNYGGSTCWWYKLDARPYSAELGDVRKTLKFLEENHEAYYTVYRVMLESGVEYVHVLKMLETWGSDEVV